MAKLFLPKGAPAGGRGLRAGTAARPEPAYCIRRMPKREGGMWGAAFGVRPSAFDFLVLILIVILNAPPSRPDYDYDYD